MDENLIILQFLLLLIATFSNMLSAFAGGGAGLVQLPLLLLLGLPFPVALATHKVASFFLGLGASLRHFQEHYLNLKFALLVLLSGLPGVYFGSKIILFIPDQVSSFLLGFLTLGIGIYSSSQSQFGIYEQTFRFTKYNLLVGCFVLFVIGILNGSLSSGTGLFVTSWLVVWFGFTYTRAIAYTLILVGLFWNGTGAIVVGLNSQIKWSWLPMLVTGSLLGGYIGSNLSLLKGNRIVKTFFELISVSIGILLIGRSFWQSFS